MPELIDKNALQEALREEYDRHKALYDEIGHIERGGIVQGLSYAKMILCKQPTIEAEPARHGYWIFGNTNTSSWMKCSECLKSQSGQTSTFSYCPNCGARMDATDTNVGGKGDEEMDLSPHADMIPEKTG